MKSRSCSDRAHRGRTGAMLLGLAVCAALAATSALAAPYTVQLNYRAVLGTGSATGSVTFDDSLLTPPGTNGPVCSTALISSFTLTFTGLSSVPSSTTFTKADLTGWVLEVGSGGQITDLNFFMGRTACTGNFNSDNYAITGIEVFALELRAATGLLIGEYELQRPAIPALSTYGVAALALLVLIAGALLLARRFW